MSVETSRRMWAGPIRWMGKRTGDGRKWQQEERVEEKEEQYRWLLCVQSTKTWTDDLKGSLEKVKYKWSKRGWMLEQEGLEERKINGEEK